MAKRAFITGVTGQDGAYLCKLLLEKGYEVAGMARNADASACWRLQELGIGTQVEVICGNVEDTADVERAVQRMKPDELYNLAAQSVSANVSWQVPRETVQVNLLGTLNVLQALERHAPGVRMFQASSSEMYGGTGHAEAVDEQTPFNPRNPYAISKVAAHHLVAGYRERGLFACAGILFNHESPLRGEAYVTRKIAMGVARIHAGHGGPIALGNLNARRDWGFAGDYVDAMWRMLRREVARDYVIATGQTHSVRHVLDAAFAAIGVRDWTPHVTVDASAAPKADVPALTGNSVKARELLQWQPKTSFEEMIRAMVEVELTRLQQPAPAAGK